MFNFRTHQVQAVMFVSSELPFRNAKVLGHFLAQRGDLFDGEPTALEPPSNLAVKGLFIPRVILANQDGSLLLQAARDRVQLVRSVSIEQDIDIDRHLAQAAEIFQEYRAVMKANVSRLAVVVERASRHENPAKAIVQHFCQGQFIEGAMNRPSAFEVHSLKQYLFSPLGQKLNSWFRCRSATVPLPEPGIGDIPTINVEQDWNSQDEGVEFWAERPNRIQEFYHLAPAELTAIMKLYFPENRGDNHEDVR